MHKHSWSPRMRILSSLAIGFALLAAAFITISYFQFKAYTIDDCVKYAYGLNNLIADELDVSHIEDYMTMGRSYPRYSQIEEQLYKLKNAYPDIIFLYVYQIQEDGCHVVFDLDSYDPNSGLVQGSEPGTMEPFDPSFEKYLPNLLSGEEIPPVISNDSYGYLLTVYTPLYDSQGVCRCYVAVDFSMNLLVKYVNDIIRKIAVLFVLVILLAFLLSAFATDIGIVEPLKQLEKTAYRDAMTGLYNRAAYLEKTEMLNILGEEAVYSIIMFDINFLKRMNDDYGHEKGNQYLRQAGALLTKYFGIERVYRNGGDEFVVILEELDQKGAEELLLPFQKEMQRLQSAPGLQPWQRVSAAAGIATFDPANDHLAADVLKRADSAMYQNKLAMKSART